MRSRAARGVVLALALGLLPAGGGAWRQDARASLAARIDPIIDVLWTGFDRLAATDHVRALSRFWRLPGNAGYDSSLDRIYERLIREMETPRGAGAIARHVPKVFFATGAPARGWDHEVGTLAVVRDGAPDEIVLSREQDRLALCINSFSTPPGGIAAPLVDVGRGDRDEDYAGRDVKGAVVLGDAAVGQLWRRAVVARGAIGVVSAELAPYISPDPPGMPPTPRDEWNILQWGSIPYDEARKGFGFKASPRAAARLRAAIRGADRGVVREETRRAPPSPDLRRVSRPLVRVTVASTFTTNPVRTLVVEVPGASAPDERVVLAAHVQEPGANDNASGVATLAELVVALWRGIAKQQIPAPSRTLTFLFLNEIAGSREWLQTNADAVPRVKYMFSLDMTGEDVAKTGGSFLVERYPDPGAVWDRPWDPHSEWGRGNVRPESLEGDLINDVHLTVARRVGERTNWVVKSNPYEGGSDHTVFGSAGIPSVLDWHFTDRYYHTNFDTPDKTSAVEMRNVAVAVGATAWFLASADEPAALDAARLVAEAGRARIALEEREGARLAAADADPDTARAREATILAAWRKWYAEAVRSAMRLLVGSPSEEFGRAVGYLASEFGTRPGRSWIEEGDPALAGGPLGAEPLGPGANGSPATEPVAPLVATDTIGQQRREPRRETPLFRCGMDEVRGEAIPLRWETLALAIDGRLYSPCRLGLHDETHRERRERAVIADARRSALPDFRRLAATGAGRLWDFPERPSIEDASPAVRLAAAVALADAGSPTPGEPRTTPAKVVEKATPAIPGQLPVELTPRARVARARELLQARLAGEPDAAVTGALLEGLGRLRYGLDSDRDDVEALILSRRDGPPVIRYGAAKGLETLIRGSARRPVSDETRLWLRQMAVAGPRSVGAPTVAGAGTAPAPGDDDLIARTRLLAVTALNAIRDDDLRTMTEIARDPEWQVRRLVAARLDATRAEHRTMLDTLALDAAAEVRYEVVGPIARAATSSKDCSGLARFLDDGSMTVALRAIDALPDECASEDGLVRTLAGWAENLERPMEFDRWHRPARAFTTLARIRSEAAEPFVDMAAAHPIWQVRAAAVIGAERMRRADRVGAMLEDAHPNVRSAALESLGRLNSPDVWRGAIAALAADDFQLLRTAAIVLEGAPSDARDDASQALLGALRRLTKAAWDTSRDPRVAILDRLGELLPVGRATELLEFVEDVDPRVGDAAARAFMQLTGAIDPPERKNPWRRYPLQPTPEEVALAPSRAIIRMKDLGTMEVELYPSEAPVTVAWFAALARAGYYDGLTFHRVVPNFVIQGGSPNANEYAGTARYMRDEIGSVPHLRGSLGISTRGRDTGDGQFFIDLVDLPRLDHEYTVFGRVVSGYDVLDRILEGAVIERVILK